MRWKRAGYRDAGALRRAEKGRKIREKSLAFPLFCGYNQQTAVRFRNGGKPRKLRKDLMILTIDIGNTTVCLGGVERLSEGGYAVRFTERLGVAGS